MTVQLRTCLLGAAVEARRQRIRIRALACVRVRAAAAAAPLRLVGAGAAGPGPGAACDRVAGGAGVGRDVPDQQRSRIDRGPEAAHLEMEVWTGRMTGRTYVSEHRAADDVLAHGRGDHRHV